MTKHTSEPPSGSFSVDGALLDSVPPPPAFGDLPAELRGAAEDPRRDLRVHDRAHDRAGDWSARARSAPRASFGPRRSGVRASPANRGALHGVDVLMVEDDGDVRWLLSRLLEREGAIVRAAASAAHGDVLLGERRPRVLLSDVGMPHEDGMSFVLRLREREAILGMPRLPAIAITAFGTPTDRRATLDAGFDAHVTKPVDFASLVTLIAHLSRPAP
jgi:CheY-like chemotaxis protein